MKLSFKSCLSAVKTCFKKYASLKGRARRSEFWYFTLFNVLLSVIGLIIVISTPNDLMKHPTALYSGMSSSDAADLALRGYINNINLNDVSYMLGVITHPVALLLFLYWIIALLPSIGVSVRRMHDLGKPGWWSLILWGAFFIGCNVPAIGGLVIIAGIVWFSIIAKEDSQPGTNQFGPNPKGIDTVSSESNPVATTMNSSRPMMASSESNKTSADKLIELKQLLDAGILTKEEFDAKKKQLLDL